MAPPRLWLSPFLIVIFIAGCPRRFDPRADEIHSQNPAAEAEYRAAQRQYQAGECGVFEQFFHRFRLFYAGKIC